jgi:hypothetical protein
MDRLLPFSHALPVLSRLSHVRWCMGSFGGICWILAVKGRCRGVQLTRNLERALALSYDPSLVLIRP